MSSQTKCVLISRHSCEILESIFLVSDPKKCCRAAGVCLLVQRRAAEAVLPSVHRPQYGRLAGVKVSITVNKLATEN